MHSAYSVTHVCATVGDPGSHCVRALLLARVRAYILAVLLQGAHQLHREPGVRVPGAVHPGRAAGDHGGLLLLLPEIPLSGRTDGVTAHLLQYRGCVVWGVCICAVLTH